MGKITWIVNSIRFDLTFLEQYRHSSGGHVNPFINPENIFNYFKPGSKPSRLLANPDRETFVSVSKNI